MKKLFIFSLVLFIVLLPLNSCGIGKIATVNGILDQATPGTLAEDLRDKCDPAFIEGGFSTFLAISINLETMEIELASRLSDAVFEVWTFRGLNGVAVVLLDKAFGAQTIVDAKWAPTPSILEWEVAKWAMLDN
ncbi:unnamed protein product [marine sediment metagenome]|uniref:Uncharacterized protein n=1 Tax=marine sediment metagenome TaxID=412755 RepID=X1BAA0_9ZZZZ